MRLIPSSTGRPAAAAAALSLLVAGLAATASPPASAERPAHGPRITTVNVHRGGPDKKVGFHRAHAGEVFLDATVSAPGVSWAQRGNESAVVSAYVDGHYATDIVITSAGQVARQFALGSLRAGHHTLRLHYANGRSPSNAGVAKLRDLAFRTVRPGSTAYAAARFAPVLYGRNVAAAGGRFQNNRTDTPLVGWHEVLPASNPAHRILEYSVVWSNEDGGTPAPALMAQWGRTTDIEWIYRVEIDAHGHRVAGRGFFQSPNHGTEKFRGRYDGTHPLLQTCTSNNNVCDSKALKAQHQAPDPMRFALSTRAGLPASQPREHVMDANPWTYQVMAREMVREGKVTDTAARPHDLRARRPAHLPLPRPGPGARGLRCGPRRGRRPERRRDDVHLGPSQPVRHALRHPSQRSGRDDGQAAAWDDARRHPVHLGASGDPAHPQRHRQHRLGGRDGHRPGVLPRTSTICRRPPSPTTPSRRPSPRPRPRR